MKSFKQIVSTIRGEDILEEGKRGLWDNIHAKRERIKNGSGERMRKPGSEGAPTEQDLKNSQTNEEVQQLEEMPGANMDTRAVHQHLKRQGWKMTRTSGSHDVFTHDEAKHHIAVPRHRQLKAPLVKGILKQAQVHEEVLEEGRPSQRHPLEGHEYHRKTDAELVYIAKDAHKAAEAMKSHNTAAENKYRDQANDSATVRYYRQKHGMADWYKKKYGHIKEEAEQINELSDKTLTSYAQKVHDDSLKHDKDPSKRSAEKRNKSVMGFSRAINKLEARPQNEEVEQVDEAMSASYRMALALKREKEKRENKDKAREARGDRFTTGPAQKPTPVQSHVTSESVNEQTASKLGQEREEVPFDKPYKTTKGTVTDKSGAKHSPMSRARDLARKAARKQAGLKEDAQIQDEVPQDKISTPAKQSLTKTAGIVKDLAKGKGKGKEGPDKFNPDPELSSEIQR
jgi:predicted RNA binding protein YcfA (HicA-like mRNA interferase family)